MDSILPLPGKSLSFRCSLRIDVGEVFEQRLVGLGFLRQHIVVVIFVAGEGDTIRIISLRKALKHERKRLEEFLRNELETD